MKPLLLTLILLVTFGCARHITTKVLSEETLVSADIIPTSYNESIKSRIQTDKRIYVIRQAFPPLQVGCKVTFLEGDDESLYISFADSNRIYYVGGKP